MPVMREEQMLSVRQISKSFDRQQVLDDVSFDLASGNVLVLLGPSGCGKTTLLRIIAGLETADSGSVFFHQQNLAEVALHQRGFGMVFQDYALFPHKDVYGNVAFGLRMQRWPADRMAARVAQVLSLVGLADYGRRAVHELSGGEQQRVALARALAAAPRLLLLDEPLGALDRALRERLMLELRDILKEAGGLLGRPEGMTAVYVTHDQAEAFAIADTVLVMRNGRVEQTGTPQTLYRQPATPFVARFLGMQNVIEGTVVSTQPLRVATPLGSLQLAADAACPPGSPLTILIRPEAGQSQPFDDANEINGLVLETSFRGRYQLVTLQVAGMTLQLEFDSGEAVPTAGETIQLWLAPDAILPLECR